MSKHKKNEIKADYIPKDWILCKHCRYFEVCPFEYECETRKRMMKQWWEDRNVRNGDSTEKIR